MKKADKAEPNVRLKEARESEGWTQKDVADRIGAPQTFLVTRWERGMARPNKIYLQRLVKIFQKSPEELGFAHQEGSEEQPSTGRQLLHPPPLTHAKLIVPRQKAVERIYALLEQQDSTAVVLTGVSGMGKSTLAALVYNFVEEQRRARKGLFKSRAFWLHIDETATLLDIASTILRALGKPVEHLANESPAQLAASLFRALNTVDKPYLFVLDQFENMLDMRTGSVLAKHQGVREWLDLLNSQPCASKLLLTSRVLPRGTHTMPRVHIEPYTLQGLSFVEGMELLRKHGVEGSETEMREAVERCEGHAYALVLLAALIQECALTLPQVLRNSTLWTDDIFTEILNKITASLEPIHLEVLYAFSIYRTAVPVEAVQAVLADLSEKDDEKRILQALRVLRKVHMLHSSGDGSFQSLAIVTEYMRNTYKEATKGVERAIFQQSHQRAALYYLQRAARECPPRESGQRTITSAYPFIEALWHLGQAERWQQAYELLDREALFADLHLCGGDASLLEIYEAFLPPEQWSCQNYQALEIYNRLGEISHALGYLRKALDAYGQALLLCRLAGKRDQEWWIYLQQGQVYNDLGHRQQAWQSYEQALRVSEEMGNLEGKAHTLSVMGWSLNNDGDSLRGQHYLEEALAHFQAVGEKDGTAWTFLRLGAVAHYLGAYEQALSYLEQARTLFDDLGNLSGQAWALGSIGVMHSYLEQYEQAISALEESKAIFREVNGPRGGSWALCRLGQIYILLKDAEKALECTEEALETFKEVGDLIGQGVCLGTLGEVYFLQHQYERATTCYLEGLALLNEVHDDRGQAEILLNLGKLYRERHCYSEALAACLLAKLHLQKIHNTSEFDVDRQVALLRKEVGQASYEQLLALPEQALIALVTET